MGVGIGSPMVVPDRSCFGHANSEECTVRRQIVLFCGNEKRGVMNSELKPHYGCVFEG